MADGDVRNCDNEHASRECARKQLTPPPADYSQEREESIYEEKHPIDSAVAPPALNQPLIKMATVRAVPPLTACDATDQDNRSVHYEGPEHQHPQQCGHRPLRVTSKRNRGQQEA